MLDQAFSSNKQLGLGVLVYKGNILITPIKKSLWGKRKEGKRIALKLFRLIR